MAGNLNTDSVIWVAGETTGVSGQGVVGTPIPTNNTTTTASGLAILDELNALEAKLTASGILPAF